jgi:FKBP-type peptidyl-prolyl cis-trans isomerase FklB
MEYVMNKTLTFFGCALLATTSMTYAAQAAKPTAEAPATQAKSTANITQKSPEPQKVSYGFGYIIGKSNVDAVKGLDADAFVAGFKDGYQNVTPSLSEEDIKKVIVQYKQNQDAQEMQAFKAESDKNMKEGEVFLAENAKKEGVKTTQSGLQYLVLTAGKGKQPKATSEVKVHYEGRLINGTVFDSSIDRGEPLTFPLDKVIAGWTEGVQLMQEGAKYRFFIPTKLAYGETGAGNIPPNSTLIFDVELLEVVK